MSRIRHMKKFAFWALALGWSGFAWAGTPTTLTSLAALSTIGNDKAGALIPVSFEATVTYFRGYEKTLFVQEGNAACYVQATTDLNLRPGDRVLVRGTTEPSFRPFVVSHDITVLRHGSLPKPIPANFDELIRAEHDSMLVSLRGTVHSADLTVRSPTVRFIVLKLLSDGGYVEVEIDSDHAEALRHLLDAEVEITGVAGGKWDGKMEQTGIALHVSDLDSLKILKLSSASPWTLPVTQMDKAITVYHVRDLTQRIHIHGTITYYEPRSAVVIQSGTKSMWISTLSQSPLHVGNVADATGFPSVRDGFLELEHGEIQESQATEPIVPRAVTWQELTASKQLFDLVSIEGQVVTAVRESSQDEYVLIADGYKFSAILRHPDTPYAPPVGPMKQVAVGSRVRVTGICSLEDSNAFDGQVPFNVLLRTQDDLIVVANRSPLNVRNLIIVVGLMFAIVIVIASRGWNLERKVRRQTANLATLTEADAALERRRSRILEDINGARPLAEIVEQITKLVTFKLYGAPCWCEIAEGARLGDCPPNVKGMRVVQHTIPGREGPALGTLFAAFDAGSKPHLVESEALGLAVGLATLAIETRRLYSDLRRRSEFDLLTDIHNRFSLEKALDVLIEQARQNASIFGLIYIDLDRFKQINDVHGHQVGDLYLQEVALRMKRQLRGVDLLARLGGDEFAALVPVVHSRSDVAEIAMRLERCFDEPFVIEGHTLHGAASLGIALYPQDSSTKDSLLSAADAAMYQAKNGKRPLALAASSAPSHRG